MKPVPHGEPYAGKLHVRFDEGAGVPHGASRSTLHPRSPLDPQSPLCIPNTSVYSVTAVGRSVCSVVKSGGERTRQARPSRLVPRKAQPGTTGWHRVLELVGSAQGCGQDGIIRA